VASGLLLLIHLWKNLGQTIRGPTNDVDIVLSPEIGNEQGLSRQVFDVLRQGPSTASASLSMLSETILDHVGIWWGEFRKTGDACQAAR